MSRFNSKFTFHGKKRFLFSSRHKKYVSTKKITQKRFNRYLEKKRKRE
jgi:hypothetical protein